MTMSPHEMLDSLLAQLDASDESVADTAPGPAPLAVIYEGQLENDLADPVIRQIRFDQFVRAVVSMGVDIAARMGSAALEYSVGSDETADAGDGDPGDGDATMTTDHEAEE